MRIILMLLLGSVATQAVAAPKPQIFIADVTPGDPTHVNDAGALGGVLSTELFKRFARCSNVVTTDTIRTLIGFERQKELLGAHDPATLAEILGAQGRPSLIITSRLDGTPEDASFNISVAHMSGREECAASSSGKISPKLVREAVAGLPDLCAPVWSGKVIATHELTVPASTQTTDFGGITARGTGSMYLKISSYVVAQAPTPRLPVSYTVTRTVTGSAQIAHKRTTDAVCGESEQIVLGGQQETVKVQTSFTLGTDEQNATWSLAVDTKRKRYKLTLAVGSHDYNLATTVETSKSACGKTTKETLREDTTSTWGGLQFESDEHVYTAETPQISGRDSRKLESEEHETGTVEESFEWNLESKPLIEVLIKAK